jgi:hypothetical protein
MEKAWGITNKGAWVINSYFKTKTRIVLQMTDGLKQVM